MTRTSICIFFSILGAVASGLFFIACRSDPNSLGVTWNNKVLQVYPIWSSLFEWKVGLHVRNSYGDDMSEEVVLNCTFGSREGIYKEVAWLTSSEQGFTVAFKNSGFCIDRPKAGYSISGAPVKILFDADQYRQ